MGIFPEGESWAGALDMSGNVQEWVNDWYDDSYYTNSPALNPLGPDSGDTKVLRGGAWSGKASNLRSAARAFANPDDQPNSVGFRCVVS